MSQLFPLPSLGVIRASGADRISYLQGQLTSDIVKQPENHWNFSGHCDPKGKMIAAFRLLKQAEQLLLLMPKSLLELDLPALSKYAVFNKIDLVDASAELQLFGLTDNAAIADWPGDDNLKQQDQALALIDGDRAIIVLPQGAELPASLAALAQGDEQQFIASELAAARPWFEAEHSSELVPQMVNLDAIGGIAYNKGCYIGQETVARMYFRGGNKRALYTLATSVDADGDDLQLKLGDNWRRAGTIIAKASDGERLLLTAVMTKELPEAPEFMLGEHTAELLERPYPLMEKQ
ncbi:YgfZ/GcvT domain-containing protein [Ferrimonas senticii]|uniref:CAF17-like 4Fe-4S cluster assembly/insertion protein YgfZ n=1 Tax=Ferrimonas senticii TaxID=394566 RepID=UPI0003F5BC0A|nr:folate-binding protein YgfZ [Ferrimonas senticii]